MTFCIVNIISYLCNGFNSMIKLSYDINVHKTLLNPVLGKRKRHQTGFFSYYVIAFESTIKGYVENVFFLLSRAATLKKEIFNKSTTCFMSLRAMTSRCQPAQQGHNKKIDLVIKMSKQFRFFSWQIFRGLKFLVS
jgi:hypothetical protein